MNINDLEDNTMYVYIRLNGLRTWTSSSSGGALKYISKQSILEATRVIGVLDDSYMFEGVNFKVKNVVHL